MEPSKGGMGIRLKMPKKTFIQITIEEKKRKGKKTARLARKTKWINTIRSQRKLLAELKDSGKIAHQTYRELYLKAKGGYFRNIRHIKLYLEEQKLLIAEVKS